MNRKADWIARAEEMLSDGEWHSGPQFVREVEKAIAPGVAFRRAERDRGTSSAKRNAGQAQERTKERSMSFLVAVGKRAMVRALVNNRVRDGGWEADPWPVREAGYVTGSWKLRSLRAGRKSVQALADEHGIQRGFVLDIVAAEPELKTLRVGRRLYVLEPAAFAERLAQFNSGTPFIAGDTTNFEWRREKVKYSTRDLMRRSNVGSRTIRELRDGHPELEWIAGNRAWWLPARNLSAWDKIAEEHKARRRTNIKAGWARRKARAALDTTTGAETPTFADSELTAAFAAYKAGDYSRREEVFELMRKAFMAAEVADEELERDAEQGAEE